MNTLHIFHPTDFSAGAEAALRFAVDAAVRLDAELLVGHVVYGGRAYWEGASTNAAGDVHAALRAHVGQELATRHQDDRDRLNVSYHVVEHETPAAGIMHFAHEQDVDLIMLGTHGRRGVRRFLLGSVALEVLHAAHTDVALIPYLAEERPDGRVLVPVDFHERSGALVAKAGELAARYGAPVDLVHVLDIGPESRLNTDSFLATDLATLSDVAADRLDELASLLGPETVVSTHVDTGRPASTLLRHIEETNARMVVMGSSGMSPEERLRRHPGDRAMGDAVRWALGRVAERVATLSPVPVWVVKNFRDEEPMFVRPEEMIEGATH